MSETTGLPDHLYHYYEASRGPFLNLSDLELEDANRILAAIRVEGKTFASQRTSEYMEIRHGLEQQVRAAFVAKGGQPCRPHPHYMVLGASPWLLDWYQAGCELRLPLSNFRPETLSFTYGDTFPAMRFQDGKPYRGQVYTLAELPAVIARFGLPQHWNAGGTRGPERYIEAQVWDDVENFYPGACIH